MSVILRPALHPSRVSLLSLQVAVAVALGIHRTCGAEAGIKWPNDIVCEGKKVCGMLLEMDADEQSVHSVVAGIGINVHQREFPPEIRTTATSLDLVTGRVNRRAEIAAGVLEAMEETGSWTEDERLMETYRELSVTLGKRVRVSTPTEIFEGVAQRVTESGSLVVDCDGGGERNVLAGDVSVRGLMGYV